jgi:hypothetical protein
MYETSAASEASDNLLKGAGLSDSSDDAIGICEAPELNYGGKTPKPHIKALIDKNRKLKQVQEQEATGKQAMGNKNRGKVGITYNHELVHRYDDERHSEFETSDEEIFLTPRDEGSKKRKIQSILRQEKISKKSRKSEKEKSIHASRDMQKRIEENSMIVLDLGSRLLDADRITTVKIDVTRMEEPNSQERVRDTDSEWVVVLVNTFKNRTSSMVAPICCNVTGLKNPGAFDVNKKHEYTYRTIGGNHSRTAFVRLLNTISDSTDSYITSKWRYSFLWIKTFFYFFLIY